MKLPELHFGDRIAQLPIIQGGMGVGISLSGLASAVANEGGVGVIAAAMIGMGEPDIAKNPNEANMRALREEIRKAKERMTQGLLGVNIMVALTNFADMVRTSIREGADVIFSGAGLPLDLPKYLREEFPGELAEKARTKLVPIVSSGRAAAILCKKWLMHYNYLPDGFVVEGPKAGGHLGFKAEEIDKPEFQLENILPEVVEAVRPFEITSGRSIPVIAAGGIYTGADIAKFLQMGASGVQMGTRFVATHECDADQAFKDAFVRARREDITVIKSPVGMPGRAIFNEFLQAVREGRKKPFKCPFHCIKSCDFTTTPYCISQALVSAKKGLLKNGFAFCGENVWRVDKITSVKELINGLKQEFDDFVAQKKAQFSIK
ncbi:nitronate monooxygenase [Humidesulfovibrio mexicanus]|uniref:Nitronate monooxygenase n=1 Tax=Humidesulfovibrio mexicanus TaxID=147047 RepID=A0A238ZIH6_9BACT|nr:nitronate monooxygenase [Humidesulfovibrio mexicanus]SNR82503.1 nitronate monooxygenase [Humidesulfovibrio mexicanus]